LREVVSEFLSYRAGYPGCTAVTANLKGAARWVIKLGDKQIRPIKELGT